MASEFYMIYLTKNEQIGNDHNLGWFSLYSSVDEYDTLEAIRRTTSNAYQRRVQYDRKFSRTFFFQGCHGDGISIPIPIPYPQESPLESPWESPYPRNPK